MSVRQGSHIQEHLTQLVGKLLKAVESYSL